jgi:hypothetical protein
MKPFAFFVSFAAFVWFTLCLGGSVRRAAA